MRRDRDGMSEAQRSGWIAVALWVLLQLTLTSLPGRDIPIALPHPLDWCGHFSLYFGLGVLVARVAAQRGWPVRRLIVAAAILSLLGALDEVHQLFIPGRDAEVGDWIVDTLGGALGLLTGMRLMASRFARWLR
jgi:VanZ family protein